jgi:hypothetical protein
MNAALKHRTRYLVVWLAFLLGGFVCSQPAGAGETVDHGIYAGLLARHVQDGIVDYGGFKAEEQLLDRYLDLLAAVDPRRLGPEEQFAFYVNAYNAWTIKLILTRYPGIRSIKEAGSLLRSPWKKPLARINGEVLTLDEIEHDILRPRFRDPRVHVAVNCASKGCPPLMAEPFFGDRLEEQLEAAARGFINDPGYNRLEGDTLFVSKIFQWFGEDFDNDPAAFVARYAEGELKQRLDALQGPPRIRYLDYDWSLNGR